MKVGLNEITITPSDMQAFRRAVAHPELSEDEVKERIALEAVRRGIDLTIGGLDTIYGSQTWQRGCED